MIKKIIATIATFCLISCSGISVNAAEIFMEQTNSSSVYSVGLISNCSVSISVSGTDLYCK